MIQDLKSFLILNKDQLYRLNRDITQDSVSYIEDDFNTAIQYLDKYIKNNFNKKDVEKLKPKGNILIIFSYNEPLILSIIPLMNALVTGNKVTIKLSKGSETLFYKIWIESGISEKYKLGLNILFNISHEDIEENISNKHAVYFFGSHKNAMKIYEVCSRNFVEFFPEVETVDYKIFNNSIIDIKHDLKKTIMDSFTHYGQSCQRIHTILVSSKYYDEYVHEARKNFSNIIDSNRNLQVNEDFINKNKKNIKILHNDIKDSNPDEVLEFKKSLPILVFGPDISSMLVKNSYFLPVLCIRKYRDTNELIEILNKKKFSLGLNIISNSKKEIDFIINNTNFSRYTLNVNHSKIRHYEGWGGILPSGFHGYKKWINFFTNSFIIIDKEY